LGDYGVGKSSILKVISKEENNFEKEGDIAMSEEIGNL